MNFQIREEIPELISPLAGFFVSVCSVPKFICSLDDGVHRMIYKSNIYKNRMMCTSYQFKIEFITIAYFKMKGK